MKSKYKIALFTSGNGTNAEEILKYFKDHASIEVVLLLSNNPQAYALERARKYSVPSRVFTRQQFHGSEEMLTWLSEAGVTHIVLAGFLWLVPTHFIKSFQRRIINIHPALLPKFGGKGMYGMKVHEAVKEAGERETGITIHEVNDHYDEGAIIFQVSCKIEPKDTPVQIADKVHALEYMHYPKVIEGWIQSKAN